MSKFDKALGFQNQFYEDSYEMTEKLGGMIIGLSDREFFRQSIEKLKRLNTPYYVLLITLSSHTPFAHITEDMVDFPLGELEGEIIGYYLRAIHYTDSAIGEFLKELSKNNMLSNTAIVIFGDHRSRLPEKELRKIGIQDMTELRKIPLIITIPNKKLGQIKETIGGHIDITPTIMNLLGIESSDRFFLGRDLLNEKNGFVIFRDGSFKSDNDAIDASIAKRMLTISDVIIEKDIIPLIRGGKCD
jgi:phosphoglycerol transferase MdoB-like AlkP superfamily enzyme